MKQVIVGAFIATAIFNLLFFKVFVGIGVGFIFLLFNFYFFFIRNKENSYTQLGIQSSCIAVFFGFLLAFRANEIVSFINYICAGFFSLISLYLYKQPKVITYKILDFLTAPFILLRDTIAGIFGEANYKKDFSSLKKPHSKSLLRGVVIALPLLFVLFVILSHADPIFNKLVNQGLSSIGERFIFSAFVLFSLVALGLAELKKSPEVKKIIEHASGKPYEAVVIVGSIVLLFAAFIMVQFRYLFSKVSIQDLHQLGINSLTYSEYVRKGFFELLIAAVITIGVAIYVLHFLHLANGKIKRVLQVSTGVLLIEVGLLLASAAQRVMLYEAANGMTRARMFGLVFLVWLSIMLLIFLVKVFRDIKQKWFFSAVISTTLIVVLGMNVINIDGLIATKYKPTVNKEIDYYYLAYLSYDGYESWKPALIYIDKEFSRLEKLQTLTVEDNRRFTWAHFTLRQLYNNREFLRAKYGSYDEFVEMYKQAKQPITAELRQMREWQSFNLAEYIAYLNIKNDPQVKQIPMLLYRTIDIDKKVSEPIRYNTPLDRSRMAPFM